MSKKQKYLFAGIIAVMLIIFIVIGTNRQSEPEPAVIEKPKSGSYDSKLEAYLSEEKNQRLVAEGPSYFKPDSILEADGTMIENPNRQEPVRPDALEQDKAALREIQQDVRQAGQNIIDPDKIQEIPASRVRGNRIYYDKNGRAYTNDGTIDERAMGQAAVDKYMAEKATSAASTNASPETEAQRKKRRIEESMGIRTMDGTQIPAVVHTTQVVGNGQEAVFRVTQDTRCGNLLIPQHTLLSAQAKISGNRVHFSVGSLRVAGRYYVVSLTGYSVDGGEGLALNISSEKKALNSEVKDAALSGVQRMIGATTVGNAVTGIVRGVSRASDRETEITVKLIDNQPINFIAE